MQSERGFVASTVFTSFVMTLLTGSSIRDNGLRARSYERS